MAFHEILDAADNLSLDEQQTLLDILRRRIAANKRKELILEIQEARNEFAKGQCRPTPVKEIMKEILS